MSYEEEWATIKASPSFQQADPRDKADMARFFARKRVKPQGGSAASMKFLAANLPAVKGAGRPDTKSAFGEGLREGFGQSAVGMMVNRQAPEAGMGILDAAGSLLPGGSNSLLGEGALRGALGATGAMVGQVPDILAGGAAGGLAAKGLARVGVKALPAAAAGSVAAGAALPAAGVMAAGGTKGQVGQAAALGAAGGLLPFASRVPAGKLNPNLTRPGKVGTMPNPGPGRAPQVDMRNTGRPAREVFRAAEPLPPNLTDFLPRVPESHRLPAGPQAPQPYPDWMTQGEFPRGAGIQRPGEVIGLPIEGAMTGQRGARPPGVPAAPGTSLVPVGPARTVIPVPPVPRPEGAMVGQQGAMPRPAAPDLLALPARAGQGVTHARGSGVIAAPPAGMVDPTAPRGLLALPPAGGTAGPIAVPPGGFKYGAVDAMTGQRGARPPAAPVGSASRVVGADPTTPDVVKFLEDGPIPPWYDPNIPPGRNMSGERFLEWEARKAAGQGYPPPHLTTREPFTLSGDPTEKFSVMIEGESWTVKARKPDGSLKSEQEVITEALMNKRHAGGHAIETQATRVPPPPGQLTLGLDLPAPRGADNPKGGRPGFALNPAAALGKVADAGARKVAAVGKRLIEDEEGSFDPVKAYQDMGRLAEQARNLWRGTKGAAGAGLRALAPVGNRTSAVERALLGGGIGSAIGERTGATAAGQRVGQAIDTALTVPLTKGPAWAQTVANAARRATQSRYNVPEDVFEQFVRVAPAKAREQFKPTTELAVDLGKRLTSGEQFDLHMQVAEPTYKGPLSPDAQRVQADNQRVSNYLLRLGVITPEEHARWGKHYLPREYAMHEAPAKAEAAKFAAGRAINRIKGTHGRGTFEVVNGQKTWRDYTIPERAKWGERRNVTRALALKKARGEQQAAAAEFLDWVSKQPAYTLDPATVAPGVPKENLPDTYTSPTGEVFRLVSDKDAIPLVHRRVKKYGGVAGKYVREDVHGFIWDQVNLDYIVKAGNMITLNPLWKRLKTIWNAPNYFINNTFHNVPMLLANGGAVSDLPAAAAKVHAGDPLVARLEADGFIHNDAMARELALKVTQILREQNASQMPGPVTLGRVLSDAADNLRALEGEGYNVAQATDDLFRVALVDRLMQDGMPYEQATKRLTDAFYQPDRVTAPAARVLGATAVPFAKVNWYLANALTKATTNDPLRVAQIVMLYYAAPYVMGALQGKGPATIDQEREALPPHMKGTGNALPIQVPGAGVPTWLNLSMANPTASMMETERSATGWPRGFQPGGLAVDLLPLVQPNGVEAFTGKPLVEYDSQNNVVADHRADYVARKFAPGVVGNAYRLEEAMRGKVTPRGDVVPKPVAIARALGLQFQPVDVENARDMAAVGAKADMAKYRAQAARLLRYAQKAREAGDEAAAEQMEREALEFMRRRAQAGEAGKERVKALGGAP